MITRAIPAHGKDMRKPVARAPGLSKLVGVRATIFAVNRDCSVLMGGTTRRMSSAVWKRKSLVVITNSLVPAMVSANAQVTY